MWAYEAITTWLKPELGAAVKFTLWAAGGGMRRPAVVGLQQD
jgi:hypothetical protein